MQPTSANILIVFNPSSTSGKAETRAKRLYRQLKRRKYNNLELVASEYAGHSEKLAYDFAKQFLTPLIISVSGDGGYNEIINGALKASNEHKKVQPVCAILAAGNANDHRRATAKRPLVRAILKGQPETMDVLELTYGSISRYAHSYIGVGVTAEASAALNAENLSRWKEIKIVAKSLLNFQHFSIRNAGRVRSLDSLVFSNIHRMSKVLKMNDKTDLHDGLFNLILMPHRTRLKFFYLLIKIVVVGVKNPPQLNKYIFQLLKPQLAQLDGEPLALPANTTITVRLRPGLIRTLR